MYICKNNSYIMKMHPILFRMAILAASLLPLVACNGGKSQTNTSDGPVEVLEKYDVKGVELKMVELPGGAFSMGALADGRFVKGAPTQHMVVLNGYAISEQPVSQALWKAVMGNNPSSAVSENLPVDRVTVKDVRKFLGKLSKLTGVPFVLPSEAQWEYAAYVGQIKPLENVREWCGDLWDEEGVHELAVDPTGGATGDVYVVRSADEREGVGGYIKGGGLTFRLAVPTGKPVPDIYRAVYIDQKPEREHVSSNEVISVNGVNINMIGVTGGSFMMGATLEQGTYGKEDEQPVQHVDVEGFEIGQTEVTVAQWKAVMGVLPVGNDERMPNKPVINVSWYKSQEFLLKLNELTGRKFRLPTEAEWEFAARGGVKSRGYRYSGSHEIYTVAVYTQTDDKGGQKGGKVAPVKTLRPNELGIYDMSGNVWEWCQDYYGPYGQEPEKSELHVNRGGSAASAWNACRVSNRSKIPASNVKGTFGFRLAL